MIRCPYFCRDGQLLVWTINSDETSTQPCPHCREPELMLDRNRMTEVGNLLDFVDWDRTVIYDSEGFAALYGWIYDEGKDRHDFVVLHFWTDDDGTQWSWTTSSTRYSPVICLLHDPDAEHNDCRPVQSELPGLVRTVDR